MLFSTFRRLIKNVYNGFGLYDCPDDDTPAVSIGAGSSAYLVSDNEGGFRLPEDKFVGKPSIYDGTTGEFDFTGLPAGTVIEMRVDLEVTTGGADTTLDLVLEAGIGSVLGAFELPFANTLYFSSAGSKRIITYQMIVLSGERIIDNPAKIKMYSNKAVDVAVNGWTLNIRKAFKESRDLG